MYVLLASTSMIAIKFNASENADSIFCKPKCNVTSTEMEKPGFHLRFL